MKQLVESISAKDAEVILDNIQAMIALVEKDGTLISWNRAFESCKRLFPQVTRLGDFFAPDDHDLLLARIASRTKEHWIINLPLPAGKGEVIIQCECHLLPLADGRSFFIAEEIHLNSAFQEVERLNKQVKLFKTESEQSKKIARRKQVEIEGVMAQAREVAETDALTFLPNRRTIIRELQDEFIRAERYQNQFSISIVDVDHFKAINDTYGHPVGDEVLRQIAIKLRDHMRHPDLVGRYGGEEFLILLPNSGLKAAEDQASRLCKLIREMEVSIHGGPALKVTISIGVAQLKHGEDTWDALLNRADNAMYEVKGKGRNGWAVAE